VGEVSEAEAGEEAGADLVFTSPSAGRYYSRPAPDEPPFVEVGQEVRKGDQLGIVEVMNLFTPLNAEADGTVVAILVENHQSVAQDDVLMLIAPG